MCFRTGVAMFAAGVRILRFGLKCWAQGCGFQDLARFLGFQISGFHELGRHLFRLQECGFQVLGRSVGFSGGEFRFGVVVFAAGV